MLIRKNNLVVVSSLSLAIFFMPLTSSAEGARIPFSGLYAGIDAGAGWATSNYQTNPGCPLYVIDAVFCNASPNPSSSNGVAVANSGSGKLNLSGFNYDVHTGYNWNKNGIVYGGEADIGGLHMSKSTATTGIFPFPFLGTNYSLYDAVSTNWLATLRGRVGVTPRSQFLLYATGGLAFTDLKVSSSYNDNAGGPGFPGGSGSANNTQFKTGWTGGIGAEWELNDAYSVKIEYLYVKFGSTNVNVPVSNTPLFMQTMKVSANLDTQVLRVGVSYHL